MSDIAQKQFISLLYPTEESKLCHTDIKNRPNISEAVVRELGLSEIFSLHGVSLTDLFTMDEEVIRYRQQTLDDCLSIPELCRVLAGVRPVLDDIRELRVLENERSESDAYLYSITEIELYVSCIELLNEGLAPLRDSFKSSAFRALADLLATLCESEYYKELNEKLGSRARLVLKNSHSGGNILAADQIENDLNLARGNSRVFEYSFCFHLVLLNYLPLLDVLEPA